MTVPSPEQYKLKHVSAKHLNLHLARPWLKDDLDAWIERLKVSPLLNSSVAYPNSNVIVLYYLLTNASAVLVVYSTFLLQGPPHKLAVVFVDNSGVDIILGMFPFIRELLSHGTKV